MGAPAAAGHTSSHPDGGSGASVLGRPHRRHETSLASDGRTLPFTKGGRKICRSDQAVHAVSPRIGGRVSQHQGGAEMFTW